MIAVAAEEVEAVAARLAEQGPRVLGASTAPADFDPVPMPPAPL